MELVKKFFPRILKENEETYFAKLEGVMSSVDEVCSMQITKTGDKYIFRIAPSHPQYLNSIIEELNKFHNLLGIRLNYSKSMKTSAIILFELSLSV